MTGNPGFEGQIWNSTIRCASGTATSCTDDDQWSGWTGGFWNGATFEVFYGAAAGRTGTVYSSTAPGNGQGLTLNFSGSGPAPATGDYLIVRKTVPGGASGGWWPSTGGSGKITDNFTDLPPGTLGKQTIVLTAPTGADSAHLAGYFDSVPNKTFLQLNGTYQVQFKAKGIGGSNQVNVMVSRAGVSTYLNQPVNLSNAWNTYTLTFTAAEDGTAIGIAGLNFATVGADAFELDDVSLIKMNGDPTNNTAFRDPVVNALRQLQPGLLRYWGGQLGDTLDNLITPAFGRQRAGYSTWYTESDQLDYGLHEFLTLCQLVGAEPWFVVPSTFNTTDASNLIEYLAGSSSSTYGAKRTALGQGAPWTQVFPKIHLEFGNEAWNSTFKGGSIEYSAPYGTRAQTIFGAMRANPSYLAANFDLVLGGQAAYPARNNDIQNNCNNNDSFDVAPYTMNQVDSFSDNESLFGSTFAEPEAYMSSTGTAEGMTPGMVYQDYQAIQNSNHPVPLSFYEINLSTLNGAITQDALNSYVPSLGAGLMVADTMLLGMKQFGIVNQELFALPQYSFNRPDGESALLWGSVIDMGVTDRKRPQYLALQLANQALSNGATMLQTVHSGADPTWNQPLVNTVQFSNAHYVQSYAFVNGTKLSAVIFNLSRNSALPVTFNGSNAPNGTVQMQQLTSANLTDTNESANVINTISSTLNGFNPATGLSLPPYSMTVLTWTSNGTSASPVISGVTASSVTPTSATITWTTDQTSSSQVQYGTSTAYGFSSIANSTLTTTHSVALSGLTAGTNYNYAAVSANAAGSSSTSSNFTFSTPAQAPVISSVSASGITANSATITWTTDQATSSAVEYGLTASYGSTASGNSALATSHSVTLTGLTPGTAYNYAAMSANSAGNSVASANFMFSTQVQAPVITAVSATAINSTSATIVWTTDQSSSSSVKYGTTTAYGSNASGNSGVTIHSVMLTGLTAGTTYNYAATSANSAGMSATSANFSFATSTQAPVISGVSATAITANAATISWTTDQPSSSQVQYGTTSAYGSSAAGGSSVTTHSVTLTGLTQGATYSYAVTSANSAGASATSANFTFATLTQAPVISAVIVSGISNNTATVNWTTDQPSSSQVTFGPSTAYGSASSLNSSLVIVHSVTLSSLTAGSAYNFAVISTNAAGNSATSSNFTFTTSTQAPVISAVTATAVTANSATITWTTDQSSSSIVQYGTYTSYGSLASGSNQVTSHSVTLSGLTAGTIYNYAAGSANSAGNSATSANFTFTTVSQAPVISAVTASSITANSATITWTTDQPSSSIVQYGTSTAYGSSASGVNQVTSHSVTLSGLTAGTTYNYAAGSANSAGNSATSANFTFTTNPATVSTQPGPQVGYVAFWGVTGSGVTISWSTNVPATTAVAYGTSPALGQLSPLQTQMTSGHGVTLTGLASGTTYYFVAQSTGANGGTGYSTAYSFTTQDTSAASISNIVVTPGTGNHATISWTTSKSTTSWVTFGPTTAYGHWSGDAFGTQPQPGMGWVPSGVVHYQLHSVDGAGNEMDSPDYTFVEP